MIGTTLIALMAGICAVRRMRLARTGKVVKGSSLRGAVELERPSSTPRSSCSSPQIGLVHDAGPARGRFARLRRRWPVHTMGLAEVENGTVEFQLVALD